MSDQKRVAFVLSNEAVSSVTGWPIGFWLAELTHPHAVFLVGGQGPMETFRHNPAIEGVVRDFYDAGKPTAVVCHATAVLLDARDGTGALIVAGKEWTGFTSAEEQYVEQTVGQRVQPFWIEHEAAEIDGTTFVAAEPMSAHAIRSGNLITGQQQNSGAAAAKLVIEDLQ